MEAKRVTVNVVKLMSKVDKNDKDKRIKAYGMIMELFRKSLFDMSKEGWQNVYFRQSVFENSVEYIQFVGVSDLEKEIQYDGYLRKKL